MPMFSFCGGALDVGARTHIMGILNVTPDSFSDGGLFFTPEAALAHAQRLQDEGADILDVGAQSTRPGHTRLSPEEEWARLKPILTLLIQEIHIPLSVDTFYTEVAVRALDKGVSILNDVSGSLQNGMAQTAASYDAGLVMMCPHTDTEQYFSQALSCAAAAGLPLSHICLDPGIGFGYTREDDLTCVAHLPALCAQWPENAILVGASRKRVVGACCGNPPFADRLPGTLAIHTIAQWNGAHILRVHDVAAAVQAARVTDALKGQR